MSLDKRDTLTGFGKNHAELTVESLDYDRLAEIVNNAKAKVQAKELAYYTVKTQLQHLRQLLTYLDDSGKWTSPRKWEKLFRFTGKRTGGRSAMLKTRAVEVFTADEIGQLAHAATTMREKTMLWFGLNFAATQQQLSQLTFDDCVSDGEATYLDLFRGKTGVQMIYDAWTETAEAMAHWQKSTTHDRKRNPDGLLLLSEDDKPMVHFSSGGNRTDNVKLTWNRLLDKSGLPKARRLSYSSLRDTAADAALRIGGEMIQQQVLAHRSQTIARKHYSQTILPRSVFAAANVVLARWYADEIAPAVAKALDAPA